MDAKEFNRLIHVFKKDKTSFDKLYSYYFPRIRIYIGRMYNDYYLGEDIAQEFFLKLFRITIPDRIQCPTLWIFKACDNLAKTFFSAQKEQIGFPEESIAADISDDQCYESLKNGGINVENLEDLKKLDEITVEIFVMRFWEGYNYKEIAEIIGLSHELVRQKASRGIRKLKRIYKKRHTLTFILSLLIK